MFLTKLIDPWTIFISGHCYKKVEAETKEIQDKIQEKLGNLKPIESDVIVLYNGENLPEQVFIKLLPIQFKMFVVSTLFMFIILYIFISSWDILKIM